MVKLLDLLNQILSEERKKTDRCLRIARRKYNKSSAYRSGAIVRCRQGRIWKGIKEEENPPNIEYIKPNFEYEWEEAIRYPEFKEMGFDNWLRIAENGHVVNFSEIKDRLGNVDLDFDGLDKDKKTRFIKALENDQIELPIAVKFSKNDYDLVGGNTRLSGLVSKGIDPKIWIVDLTALKEVQLTEKQKETLRTWFKRKGAPGKTGGWVDCNSPIRKDGKITGYKPCGRQKGEERAEYPSCRPTAARCKDKGKGTKWGKTK